MPAACGAHVTLNTLVRDGEMAALEAQICEIAEAGADAVIVQDLGVAALVRRMAPGLSLHASTQMAVHDRQGVEYLRDHGFDRAVLAREMPLAEIEQCAGLGVGTGSLLPRGRCACAALGNACFPASWAGRSGNRGMCAQPCRLPYRLGEARGYLLSPRDIMLLDDLQAMERGRGSAPSRSRGGLKRPEYVAVVTSVYRRALDGKPISDADREALLQIFNRGGFQPWLPARYERCGADVSRAGPTTWACWWGAGGALRRDVDAEDALAERRGDVERPVKLQGRAGARVSVRGDIYRLVGRGADARGAGKLCP